MEGNEIRLDVRVQPRASRNAIVLDPDGRIRVALTAPPVEGAANEALRKVLADALGLSRRAVRVVGGEKSRDKTVAIMGLTETEIRGKLRKD